VGYVAMVMSIFCGSYVAIMGAQITKRIYPELHSCFLKFVRSWLLLTVTNQRSIRACWVL